MKINKILKLKNNKYKITIDNEVITTNDNVILENGLLFKKEIDKTLYKKILSDTLFYDNYNDILKFVMKKVRSKKEIIEYINKFNFSSDNRKKIIDKLNDAHLIDDAKYASSYINDKLNLSKYGIDKIKKDLLLNNISINIIDSEISKIENTKELEKLEKLILKKINSNHKYSNNYLKQKILNEMLTLGYKKDDIINILSTNLKDDNNILESEYNKNYNKLKQKYSGVELNNKIKYKLISKGFKVDEINTLLQKKAEE